MNNEIELIRTIDHSFKDEIIKVFVKERISYLQKSKYVIFLKKCKKNKFMTNLEATFKAKLLLIDYSVDRLAKAIGITKPTLYTRLSENNWKKGEIALLERL